MGTNYVGTNYILHFSAVNVAIIDGISAEKAYLFGVKVALYAFTVVLRFDKKEFSFKKGLNVSKALLSREHRFDRVK